MAIQDDEEDLSWHQLCGLLPPPLGFLDKTAPFFPSSLAGGRFFFLCSYPRTCERKPNMVRDRPMSNVAQAPLDHLPAQPGPVNL
jgi:hypothetical protein